MIMSSHYRHAREGGHPGMLPLSRMLKADPTPACAGVTMRKT